MKDLIRKINEVEGIKSARMRGEKLVLIKPHKVELENQDEDRIPVDLRKVSRKLKEILDNSEEVKSWNWNKKPKKKYDETGLGGSVSHRKSKGYDPSDYLITVERI